MKSLKSKIQMSSNRSFGLVFFFVFLLIGLWPLHNDGTIRLWSIFISITFLFLGAVNSKLLIPLNKLWFKLGITLGNIVSPIVIAIVFFTVVTPIGLFMKMLKKDLLNLKYNKEKKTYWIKRSSSIGTMKRQF